MKIIKDLCMTCVLFTGAVLSIALGATGVPNDVENRTLYPIIARPVARWQYVAGKFLGTFLTVTLGVSALSAVFGGLIYHYQGSFDWFLPAATIFALLEAAVVAAVATTLSTFASPVIAASVSFMVYLCGTIKIGFFGGMLDLATNSTVKLVGGIVYHFLPNLECFNLKAALVHGDSVPTAYLAQVAIYGLCYTVFVIWLGAVIFKHREV
ncbi:MAG: ABC transporter permease [Armatimonadetes bacterium]|nr:ABC transporter permease [Armatimonadota bacterium]